MPQGRFITQQFNKRRFGYYAALRKSAVCALTAQIESACTINMQRGLAYKFKSYSSRFNTCRFNQFRYGSVVWLQKSVQAQAKSGSSLYPLRKRWVEFQIVCAALADPICFLKRNTDVDLQQDSELGLAKNILRSQDASFNADAVNSLDINFKRGVYRKKNSDNRFNLQGFNQQAFYRRFNSLLNINSRSVIEADYQRKIQGSYSLAQNSSIEFDESKRHRCRLNTDMVINAVSVINPNMYRYVTVGYNQNSNVSTACNLIRRVLSTECTGNAIFDCDGARLVNTFVVMDNENILFVAPARLHSIICTLQPEAVLESLNQRFISIEQDVKGDASTGLTVRLLRTFPSLYTSELAFNRFGFNSSSFGRSKRHRLSLSAYSDTGLQSAKYAFGEAGMAVLSAFVSDFSGRLRTVLDVGHEIASVLSFDAKRIRTLSSDLEVLSESGFIPNLLRTFPSLYTSELVFNRFGFNSSSFGRSKRHRQSLSAYSDTGLQSAKYAFGEAGMLTGSDIWTSAGRLLTNSSLVLLGGADLSCYWNMFIDLQSTTLSSKAGIDVIVSYYITTLYTLITQAPELETYVVRLDRAKIV